MISNAVKYSPKKTTIECRYAVSEDEVHFMVKDVGGGIDTKDQKKIFKRYYRVEDDLSKTTSGFGIGLYFCAEIISFHNGKIWVESELGKGSTFHVTIPR